MTVRATGLVVLALLALLAAPSALAAPACSPTEVGVVLAQPSCGACAAVPDQPLNACATFPACGGALFALVPGTLSATCFTCLNAQATTAGATFAQVGAACAPPPSALTLLDAGTPPTTPYLLIRDVVLVKDAYTALDGGALLVNRTSARILCADTAAVCAVMASGLGARVLSGANAAVLAPGLINAHDHLQYNYQPPRPIGETYANHWEWHATVGNYNGKAKLGELGSLSGFAEAVVWAELRHIMAGTTSVVDSAGVARLLRNLDAPNPLLTQLSPSTEIRYQTFPYASRPPTFSGAPQCAEFNFAAAATLYPTPTSTLETHLGEGTDAISRTELECMLALGLVHANLTIIVHGIAATPAVVAAYAALSTGVMWSARSEAALYRAATPAAAMRAAGVEVALSTDWTPSGSRDMLRELRCARAAVDTVMGGALSDADLLDMSTRAAAKLTKTTNQLGRLVPGLLADVALYAAPGVTAATAATYIVNAASQASVLMTMVHGRALYGDAGAMADLWPVASGGALLEPLQTCGASQKALLWEPAGWGVAETSLNALRAALEAAAGGAANVYALSEPAASCAAPPPGEPECSYVPRFAPNPTCTPADVALVVATPACASCLPPTFSGPFGACPSAGACQAVIGPGLTSKCFACASQLASEGASLSQIAIACQYLPLTWTTSAKCSPSYYGGCDGTDCGCGALDPDSWSANPACRAPTYCGGVSTTTQTCSPVTATCSVPAPKACTPADQAVVFALPDCVACLPPTFSGPLGACPTFGACASQLAISAPCGACVQQLVGEGQTGSYILQKCSVLPAAWATSPTCSPSTYSACDGTNCGCGVIDPDETSSNAACHAVSTCPVGQPCSPAGVCVAPTPPPTPAPPPTCDPEGCTATFPSGAKVVDANATHAYFWTRTSTAAAVTLRVCGVDVNDITYAPTTPYDPDNEPLPACYLDPASCPRTTACIERAFDDVLRDDYASAAYDFTVRARLNVSAIAAVAASPIGTWLVYTWSACGGAARVHGLFQLPNGARGVPAAGYTALSFGAVVDVRNSPALPALAALEAQNNYVGLSPTSTAGPTDGYYVPHVWVGDMIDASHAGTNGTAQAETREDYRQEWRELHARPEVQRMNARTTTYAAPFQGEVQRGVRAGFPPTGAALETGVTQMEAGVTRIVNAMNAYAEYVPRSNNTFSEYVRELVSGPGAFLNWGRTTAISDADYWNAYTLWSCARVPRYHVESISADVDLFITDVEACRSPSIATECSLPELGNKPCPVGPAASQSLRTLIYQQLGLIGPTQTAPPLPAACTNAFFDKGRSVLGFLQMDRLQNDLRASKAARKLIVTPMRFNPSLFTPPYNTWAEYGLETAQLLQFIADNNICGVRFISESERIAGVSIVRDLAGYPSMAEYHVPPLAGETRADLVGPSYASSFVPGVLGLGEWVQFNGATRGTMVLDFDRARDLEIYFFIDENGAPIIGTSFQYPFLNGVGMAVNVQLLSVGEFGVDPAFSVQVRGCDGVMCSGLEFDRCGVCGGDGTACGQPMCMIAAKQLCKPHDIDIMFAGPCGACFGPPSSTPPFLACQNATDCLAFLQSLPQSAFSHCGSCLLEKLAADPSLSTYALLDACSAYVGSSRSVARAHGGASALLSRLALNGSPLSAYLGDVDRAAAANKAAGGKQRGAHGATGLASIGSGAAAMRAAILAGTATQNGVLAAALAAAPLTEMEKRFGVVRRPAATTFATRVSAQTATCSALTPAPTPGLDYTLEAVSASADGLRCEPAPRNGARAGLTAEEARFAALTEGGAGAGARAGRSASGAVPLRTAMPRPEEYPIVILPVCFSVLWTRTTENYSEERLQLIIDKMSDDWRGRTAAKRYVRPGTSIADMRIEFKLIEVRRKHWPAQMQRATTFDPIFDYPAGELFAQSGGFAPYPPTKCINIYTVPDFAGTTPLGIGWSAGIAPFGFEISQIFGTAIGFSIYPGAVPLPAAQLNVTGTTLVHELLWPYTDPTMNSVSTHEAGHAVGALRHEADIFCNNNWIYDFPGTVPQGGWGFHALHEMPSCQGNATKEDSSNFMQYTAENIQSHFTVGQVQYTRAHLLYLDELAPILDAPLTLSASIVDGCGVLGGDNSTCAGCDGVPHSGLRTDRCGECGGDGYACGGCMDLQAHPGPGVLGTFQNFAINGGTMAMMDACGQCSGAMRAMNWPHRTFPLAYEMRHEGFQFGHNEAGQRAVAARFDDEAAYEEHGSCVYGVVVHFAGAQLDAHPDAAFRIEMRLPAADGTPGALIPGFSKRVLVRDIAVDVTRQQAPPVQRLDDYLTQSPLSGYKAYDYTQPTPFDGWQLNMYRRDRTYTFWGNGTCAEVPRRGGFFVSIEAEYASAAASEAVRVSGPRATAGKFYVRDAAGVRAHAEYTTAVMFPERTADYNDTWILGASGGWQQAKKVVGASLRLAVYPVLKSRGPCPAVPAGGATVDDRLGCDGVPYSGKVYDACFVCGGRGESCLGCNAAAFSNATIDRCGICSQSGQFKRDSTCRGCAKNMMPDECGRCVLATSNYPIGTLKLTSARSGGASGPIFRIGPYSPSSPVLGQLQLYDRDLNAGNWGGASELHGVALEVEYARSSRGLAARAVVYAVNADLSLGALLASAPLPLAQMRDDSERGAYTYVWLDAPLSLAGVERLAVGYDRVPYTEVARGQPLSGVPGNGFMGELDIENTFGVYSTAAIYVERHEAVMSRYVQDWTGTWVRLIPGVGGASDINGTVIEYTTRQNVWPLFTGSRDCGNTCAKTGGCDGLGGVRDVCGVCNGDGTWCAGCDGASDGRSARTQGVCAACTAERLLIINDADYASTPGPEKFRGGPAPFTQAMYKGAQDDSAPSRTVIPLGHGAAQNAIANRYELPAGSSAGLTTLYGVEVEVSWFAYDSPDDTFNVIVYADGNSRPYFPIYREAVRVRDVAWQVRDHGRIKIALATPVTLPSKVWIGVETTYVAKPTVAIFDNDAGAEHTSFPNPGAVRAFGVLPHLTRSTSLRTYYRQFSGEAWFPDGAYGLGSDGRGGPATLLNVTAGIFPIVGGPLDANGRLVLFADAAKTCGGALCAATSDLAQCTQCGAPFPQRIADACGAACALVTREMPWGSVVPLLGSSLLGVPLSLTGHSQSLLDGFYNLVNLESLPISGLGRVVGVAVRLVNLVGAPAMRVVVRRAKASVGTTFQASGTSTISSDVYTPTYFPGEIVAAEWITPTTLATDHYFAQPITEPAGAYFVGVEIVYPTGLPGGPQLPSANRLAVGFAFAHAEDAAFYGINMADHSTGLVQANNTAFVRRHGGIATPSDGGTAKEIYRPFATVFQNALFGDPNKPGTFGVRGAFSIAPILGSCARTTGCGSALAPPPITAQCLVCASGGDQLCYGDTCPGAQCPFSQCTPTTCPAGYTCNELYAGDCACTLAPSLPAWLQADACGVCAGFNAKCTDCAGVVGGAARKDACGVCGGNNATCAGCDGVPRSGKRVDECGVCGGHGETCRCATSADCANGGHCNLVRQTCECCEGFAGPLCEQRTCTPAQCGAHGTCASAEGVCVCAPGWAGAACDVGLCSLHGTWSAATRACRCAAGWQGARCDTPAELPPQAPHGGACGASALTLRHECTCRLDDGATCRSVLVANNTGAAPLAAPAGSALNSFFPGAADRGQPHVYAPAVPVRVAVEWPCAEQRLTWIVRAGGAFAEAVAVPSDAACGSACGCGSDV